MARHAQFGHANLTTIFLLLGLAALTVVWILAGKIRARRRRHQKRARLIKLFESQTASDKRLQLAFAVIEVNEYRRVGLEAIAPRFQELFLTTLKRALGDKQHQVRGMAASHLGVIGDDTVVPHLLAALEDDHAYVRSSAALGLGRLRATAAKEKLAYVSKEDWDQTVRSRAREALERIR